MPSQPRHLRIVVSSKAPSLGKTYAAKIIEQLIAEEVAAGNLHPAPIEHAESSHTVRRRFDAVHGTNTLEDEVEKQARRVDLGAFARAMTDTEPHWLTSEILQKEAHIISSGFRDPESVDQMREGGAFLIRIVATDEVVKSQMGEDGHARYLTDPREHELDNYPHWHEVIWNHITPEFEEHVRTAFKKALEHHKKLQD